MRKIYSNISQFKNYEEDRSLKNSKIFEHLSCARCKKQTQILLQKNKEVLEKSFIILIFKLVFG